MSDGQTCGVFRTPKHVVECEFLLGTSNPLKRSRRSDIQTCGKMQFGAAPCSLYARAEGQPSKACKIVILTVQMQLWEN